MKVVEEKEEATDACRRGQPRLLPWPPDTAWPARLLLPLFLTRTAPELRFSRQLLIARYRVRYEDKWAHN